MAACILIYISMTLHSAFEYGSGDPLHLFPYSRAVQDLSAPVAVMNPALLPFCRGLILTASAGMPYYGFDLKSAGSSVQYSQDGYGLAANWNSFGCDQYSENRFSAGAGLSIFGMLGIGLTGDCYLLSAETDEAAFNEVIYDTGAGLSVLPFEWIQGGFFLRNIYSGICGSGSVYGEWSCGLQLRPCRGLSFSWNLTDNPAGRINTFILTVNPLKYLSTGFGYSCESSSFAAYLGVMWGCAMINYSIRFHPYLGYSHAVSFTWSGSAEIEGLSYWKEPAPAAKRININTASYDELIATGFLSERSARRIILHREKIGPLSKKSLVQIGFSAEEIASAENTFYGFDEAREEEAKEKFKAPAKKKGKFVAYKERTKQRFRKMLDAGIPAYQAALYSDLSNSDDETFDETLTADMSLNDEQKKIIRKICRG